MNMSGFFLEHVRGDNGFFDLIESVDDIKWAEDPAPSARKALGGMIKPLETISGNADKGYTLKGSLVFMSALWNAKIIVDKKGFLKIEEEEFLVDDIPVRDTVFG